MTFPIIPLFSLYKTVYRSSAQQFVLNHVGLHLNYLSSYLSTSTENSEPFDAAGNSCIYGLNPFHIFLSARFWDVITQFHERPKYIIQMRISSCLYPPLTSLEAEEELLVSKTNRLYF